MAEKSGRVFPQPRSDHLHQWVEDGPANWVCDICHKPFGPVSSSWDLKLRPDAVDATVFAERSVLSTPSYVHLGDRQLAVYNILKDGEWHDGPELTHPAVGGSEGLRRLRELREKGYRIEMRRKAKGRTTRQYRLVR